MAKHSIVSASAIESKAMKSSAIVWDETMMAIVERANGLTR
jgi:hypothetical protein